MRAIPFFLMVLCAIVGVRSAIAESRPAILRNTYYYVTLESLYSQLPRDTAVLDMRGDLVAYVSAKFKKATDIEGTGRLVDGRIINYAGRVNGEIRYLVANSRWGYGVGKCELLPFKTVAVDPNVIPLGSLVFIKETKGMLLPNGHRHSGYWRADDIGGAIKKDRIDLFVGDGDQGATLEKAGIHNLQPLTVSVVAPPKTDSCVHAVQF